MFLTYFGDVRKPVLSKELKTSQSSTPTSSNVNLRIIRRYIEEAKKSWVLNNPTKQDGLTIELSNKGRLRSERLQ